MIAEDFQIQQLKVFKFKQEYIDSVGKYSPNLEDYVDRYVILGEVGNIKHYVVLNYYTGQILPGIFHLEDFDEVPEEDL